MPVQQLEAARPGPRKRKRNGYKGNKCRKRSLRGRLELQDCAELRVLVLRGTSQLVRTSRLETV